MADGIEDSSDTIIPDADKLFCRIHFQHYDKAKKRILSVAFKRNDLSVNWEQHCTAEATARPTSQFVVSFNTGECRHELNQKVVYCPIPNTDPDGPNPAHAEIQGDKSQNEVAAKLRDKAKIEWTRPT